MRAWLRDLLGTAEILSAIQQHRQRQEITMASVIDALRALAEQTNDVSAAQATSFTNLQNAVARLEQAVRDGEVSPEIQAAVDELSASLTRLGDDARRADDGFEPQPETPADPEQPAEPLPADGETPADVTEPTVPQRTQR
ncbi:hypothetical protein [Catenuloplanes indicus]|uniref:Uncharacterized protein n=1 Tax=Catenuloplanes indicus TaxID=137267 RepID=A0AAE4B4L6_9ACTN|nr:hypothetical protein [Catenuloplanes indicus]MDQ0371598.1 hypothetical protein [Catenuloplanes indicus]MDQ0371611.1 hypothetical protein [Catenuloplanes indicus]